MAVELGICEKTVEFHLNNVYSKTGVGTRTEAVAWALRKVADQKTRVTKFLVALRIKLAYTTRMEWMAFRNLSGSDRTKYGKAIP